MITCGIRDSVIKNILASALISLGSATPGEEREFHENAQVAQRKGTQATC